MSATSISLAIKALTWLELGTELAISYKVLRETLAANTGITEAEVDILRQAVRDRAERRVNG